MTRMMKVASLYCCVFSSFLKDRGKKKSMVGRYSVVYNFFDHFVSLGRLTQFLIGFSFKETVSCIFCLAYSSSTSTKGTDKAEKN